MQINLPSIAYPCQRPYYYAGQVRFPQHNHPGYLTNTTCSLSVIIICRIHLDLLEKNPHVNGSTYSSPFPIGSFHAATRRIHNVIIDEFGDRNVTEAFDTGISSSDVIELQDIPASDTECINLDEYPWAGVSLGELDNTLAMVPQHSGKLSLSLLFFIFFDHVGLLHLRS